MNSQCVKKKSFSPLFSSAIERQAKRKKKNGASAYSESGSYAASKCIAIVNDLTLIKEIASASNFNRSGEKFEACRENSEISTPRKVFIYSAHVEKAHGMGLLNYETMLSPDTTKTKHCCCILYSGSLSTSLKMTRHLIEKIKNFPRA